MTQNSGNGLSDLETYKLIRGQIEHEDNLITQRLSWFVASQSFLFTAYAITLNGPVIARRDMFGQQINTMVVVIPVLAILVCVLIYLSIVAGVIALRHLRAQARRLALTHFPPIQGMRHARILGLTSPLIIPLAFIATWLVLLIKEFSAAG